MGTFNKRIATAVLFVLLAVTQTATVAAQSGTLSDNVSWRLSGGTLTISGNSTMPSYGSGVDSPWYNQRASITRITIENGITAIGNYAFSGCMSVTGVSIPESVTSIGEHSFNNCVALTSVVIPNSVTYIGNSAFSGCRTLASTTIGRGVTEISSGAFSETGLTEITIPEGVVIIKGSAFLRANRLTTVYFNAINAADLPLTDVRVFEECNSLKTVIFGDSVRRIPNSILTGQKSVETVTIGNSVTHIGESAFNSCSGLSSVTIGGNVIEIGVRTFAYCGSLRSITIPDSVTYIGNFAFYECENLASAVIGKNVSTIMPQAFGKTGLTEITVPEGITEMVGSTFQSCARLRTVYWNAANIKDFVSTGSPFYDCRSITVVVIGDNVRKIPSNLFAGVRSLEKITIGSHVTQIGDNAFSDGDNITDISSRAARPPQVHSNVFRGWDKSFITLQVPAASLAAYKAHADWKDFQFAEEAAHGR